MSKRTFTVDGRKWTCEFGRGNVSIRAEDGHRVVVDYHKLTGRSWDVIERGQWKKTSDGMITPACVKRYISEKLVKAP
jgi:hypothetical protein